MKAMVLAAGFGTRLWPLTIGRTKPAIPFLNRPLIVSTIEYLRSFGINELIINLHHEPGSVSNQIGDGSQYGVSIDYSIEEPDILGTSGALDRVRNRLDQETFIVMNGKVITDIDLNAALKTHRERGALTTLVLRPNPKLERFSEVRIDIENRITEFAGFPKHHDDSGSHIPLMFTGIHILEPGIFEYIPIGVFSDSVIDVYPKAIAAGERIMAHVATGDWFELSTIERYLSISLEFLKRENRDVITGEGCVIDAGANVRRSVLWKRVSVAEGATLTDCVVGDDVRIPAGAVFEKAAIVRAGQAANTEKPEKALSAVIVGDNLVVKFG